MLTLWEGFLGRYLLLPKLAGNRNSEAALRITYLAFNIPKQMHILKAAADPIPESVLAKMGIW